MRRREQTFRRERYLEPREALRRLLRNSSFVREPAAVVRRAAIEQEGLFDTTVGGATDTDMWVRLFSRYGVRCLPQATCAYTIHEAAATTGMWNPGTIRANGEIFDRAVARGIVPERIIRRWQADWYHQFILAGAYRRLRMGRRAEAREVLRLFELPDVRDRGVSPKWLPVRAAFTAATAGAPQGLTAAAGRASVRTGSARPGAAPGLLRVRSQQLPVERHAAVGVVGVERRDDSPALTPASAGRLDRPATCRIVDRPSRAGPDRDLLGARTGVARGRQRLTPACRGRVAAGRVHIQVPAQAAARRSRVAGPSSRSM